MTRHLTLTDLIHIRDQVAASAPPDELALDPAFRYELVNPNGLISSLTTPFQAAFGAESFPSVLEKAAALTFLLISNHPFRDGNKRIAAEALRLFLTRNQHTLFATTDDLEHFTMMATRAHLRDDALLAWLSEHTQQLPNN